MSHPRPRRIQQPRPLNPSSQTVSRSPLSSRTNIQPPSHRGQQHPSRTRVMLSPVTSQHPDEEDGSNDNRSDINDEDDDENDQEIEEIVKSKKRSGPELLRDALEEASDKKRRRKGGARESESVKKTALAAYKKAGRWIVRAFGPWVDINEAFRRGLAEDGFFEIETPPNTDEDGTDEKHDALLKLYRSVLALVPNFKKTIEGFGDDFESITELINLMDQESQSARQQDTHKMKENIPDFFTHYSHIPHELPIPRDKTGRGFNHMWTARALCPRSYIHSFTEQPGFLERITNGDVEITSDQFPNFLYDLDEAEELTEENPGDWDPEKGLLRSSLCLWSYKCIFMGNGFWEPRNKKKKAPVSKINGLTQVTPATIAYAIAQARFALSSCEDWGAEDALFVLQDFYRAILELFDDEEDGWVIDTLAWWNEQIFPDKLGTKTKGKDRRADADPNSARSKVKRARLKCAEERRQTANAN